MSMTYGGDTIQDTDGGVLRPISSVMRNRIINGGMVIDQRNAGASVTPAQDNYMTDRWKWGQSQSSKFTAQQSTTAPSGFTNSLLMTVSSAVTIGSSDYFSVYQPIEGYNVADLGWGTANAKTVTLSFWVRSSLTGTFGGAIRNNAGNRSYPFTYTISSANTWEYETITIAGDTSGTWLTTNGVGMYLQFGLGVGSTLSGTAGAWAGANYLSATGATSVAGTSGATFYITGCQLEIGTSATGFEYRQYGQELALCQRYYYKWINDTGVNRDFATIQAYSTTAAFGKLFDFPVTMRTTPTTSFSGTVYPNSATAGALGNFSIFNPSQVTKQGVGTGNAAGSSGLVAGNATIVTCATGTYIDASAEL